MVRYFLLPDGSERATVVSEGSIPLEMLMQLLVGRRLSSARESLPAYRAGPAKRQLKGFTGWNRVAIRIDEPEEALRVGAKPGCYHLVRNLAPEELARAVAEMSDAPGRSQARAK
jgi:hypothetical protein